MVFFSHRTKRESPAGEQFWKFSRQCSIFGCIGDQWVTIIFEPWKKRTLHPIRGQLNTSTKYNSDSLLSFYSLNFKKQKLNVPSYTCSRRMSSLSFSSPSTSPWTPASSLPGKKKRECDDKVKELHCKHSQLKKVQNNLFYFTDLAHFSIHLELKLNITYSVGV